jgi:hypothetical protein
MKFRRVEAFHPVPPIAVAVATALAAAPAFALSLDMPQLPYPPQDLLLYGSIGLLVVAVALRLFQEAQRADPTPPAPDLRWWRNVQS